MSIPWKAMRDQQFLYNGKPATQVFQSEGFVPCWEDQRLLSPSTCSSLRSHILEELHDQIQQEAATRADDETRDFGGEHSSSDRFSCIRQRINRWDLKLNDTNVVREALREVLNGNMSTNDSLVDTQSKSPNHNDTFLHRVMAPLLDVGVDAHGEEESENIDENLMPDQQPIAPRKPTLAEDVILVELGALISDPDAPDQEWHPDSVHLNARESHILGESFSENCDATNNNEDSCLSAAQEGVVVCCFITLQPTPESLGPTQILPRTQTCDFHGCALVNFPPKGILPYSDMGSLTDRKVPGYQNTGEGCLMDTRVYHRGGANKGLDSMFRQKECQDIPNPERRVVFYFSFRSRLAKFPGGFLYTVMEHLKDKQLQSFLE